MRNPRDFWAGAIYLALGVAVLWIGRNYPLGSSARMGPGYFPAVLGYLMAGFGLISLGRSFIVPGETISQIAWKPLALILGSVVLFALLLEPAGVVIALAALIGVSSLASSKTRYDLRSLAAMAGMIAFCVLVFVKGLGLPLPVLGRWFTG